MSWTEERIERLKKMWHDGSTASQIADELGGVSRNAVIGKAHRLGLKARPSPVKPNEREGEAQTAAAAAPAEPAREPKPAPARDRGPAAAPARPAAPNPRRPRAVAAAPFPCAGPRSIARPPLGRRQVVGHRFLVPASAGSNPAAPASARGAAALA